MYICSCTCISGIKYSQNQHVRLSACVARPCGRPCQRIGCKNRLARACQQARAARAKLLPGLEIRPPPGPVQDRSGPVRSGFSPVRSGTGPVSDRSGPRSPSPLLFGPRSRPVRSGPVRSWTDFTPIMSRISRAVYAMVGTDTCSNTTADRAIGRQFTLDESSMLAWKWQVKISLSNFSLFNIKNKFTFLKIKIIFIKISNFLMYNYYIY